MPTKEITLQNILLHGSGNFVLNTSGQLYVFPSASFSPAKDSYAVEVNGARSKKYISAGGLPGMAGGRMLVQLSDVKLESSTPSDGPAVIQSFGLTGTDESGGRLATYDPAKTPIEIFTESGEILATTIASNIVKGYTEETIRLPSSPITANSVIDSGSKKLNLPVGIQEEAEVFKRRKENMYTGTSIVMVKVNNLFWSAQRWNGGPIQDGMKLWVSVPGRVLLGIPDLTFNTPFGVYSAKIRATENIPSSYSSFPINWKTDEAAIPQYGATSLSLKGFNLESGAMGNISNEFVVYDERRAIIASGPNVSFKGGKTFTLKFTGEAIGPTIIKSATIIVTYEEAEISQPPPPTGGAVIQQPEVTGPSSFGHAAVPAGARRILRHPLMAPGCKVVNQNGVLCTWESANYLLLPPGTVSVDWEKDGGWFPTMPPNTSLPTARSWGDCLITETNTAPADIEVNFGTVPNIRRYTPDIKVSVAGIDATLDLTSAGGGQASYEGDFDLMAGVLPMIDGGDMIISLDGVVVEWHKIVEYHRSSNDEGATVSVSGVDPLEYHNVDINSLYKEREQAADPRKDLAAYALDIANHAGLKLSGVIGMAFPQTEADTKGDDAYTFYGNTVTQELELIANAGLSTVVTDAPSQTVRFLSLDTLIKGGGKVIKTNSVKSGKEEKSCSFISQGYSLGDGYAIVEVSGVSNTLRTDTKSANIPVIRVGSNGAQTDTATDINTWAGQNYPLRGYEEDKTMWWPDDSIREAVVARGTRWIPFQTLKDGINPVLYPIPIRLNSEGLVSEDVEAQYQNGGVISLGHPLAPKLVQPSGTGDPRKTYWITSRNAYSGNTGPIEGWGQGEMHSGYYWIDQIEFLVESPQQIRERVYMGKGQSLPAANNWMLPPGVTIPPAWLEHAGTSSNTAKPLTQEEAEEKFPDTFGPCITAFRVHIKDDGLYGYAVYFRIGFNAFVLDESRISLLPFIMSPTDVPAAGKLPHKKVTIQNPFIVQERPKNTKWGSTPDLSSSPAYQLGVKLANQLTTWEAMKRFTGEVKVLGGLGGRVGDRIEGMTIISQPTAEIVPGEACWTIFKTSSYTGTSQSPADNQPGGSSWLPQTSTS